MRPCLIAALLLLALVSAAPRYSSRIVEISSGAIRGIILEPNSRHLEPVEAFLGVPYAAPPVGQLRYAPANPPLNWTGTRLADALGPVCPQKFPDLSNKTAALQHMPVGRYQQLLRMEPYLGNYSEDCLHLNIYVPGSGSRGVDAPYAVIVFIHGESYEWNAGNHYDGSVLASSGHIIFVSINYRLGILGFLKTQTGHTQSGNWAVSDVIAALEWIKINIASFGGDPTRITLFGHDTGAALVNIVLLTPSVKGLFHRVTLLSGSILSPWSFVHDPDSIRSNVADQLGCTLSDNLAPCLRTHTLASLLQVNLTPPRFLAGFGPHLFTDPNVALEKAGDNFVTTPLMAGVVTTESYLNFNANDIQYGFEEDQRNRVLRTYVRNAYVYHLNEIFSTIRNEYTDWDKNWLCSFCFQRLGSVRGEDLPYILGLPLVQGLPFFPQNYSKQDIAISESMVTFFTNYAKTGDPNKHDHRGVIKDRSKYWDPYETGTQEYLSIGVKSKMKSHYRGHKMAVWLNLIPQLHQPGDEDVSMRHHHFHERANHYYAGVVKPETFTKLPPLLTTTTKLNIECEPNSTLPNENTLLDKSHDHSVVKPETFTKLPPLLTTTTKLNIECEPNSTLPNENTLLDKSHDHSNNGVNEDEDSEESLLEKIARKHYSYTTALGVTVGIGCLLLILNIVIFTAIYYQRRRKKKSRERDGKSDEINSDINHSDNFDNFSLTQLSIAVGDKSPYSNSIQLNNTNAILTKSPSIPEPPPPPKNMPPLVVVPPPKLPNRLNSCLSNSSTNVNSVKKRVQIQEISV
ncbi:neuroligin-4, X-linked-like [Diaphorina citri]|uniref:Neuroligin-4, X-linked-like n=1 Tax=Diaphorina citri TaxID=121845 RepID=A0A3Q0ITM4_DIACI|nr:neuroligin-4, X-linked-like [Diaphorina citri]